MITQIVLPLWFLQHNSGIRIYIKMEKFVFLFYIHHNKTLLIHKKKLYKNGEPVLSIEDVLLSVQSMILDPNLESPANVDAAIQLKNDPTNYKKRVRQLVRKSI